MKETKIVFFADGHSYWYGDNRLPSVGQYLKKYFPKFQDSYWQSHIALKRMLGKDYMDHYRSIKGFAPPAEDLFPPMLSKVSANEYYDVKKQVEMEWDRKRNDSAMRGTNLHNFCEDEAYKNGFLANPFDNKLYDVSKYEKEFDNESLMMNLYDLPDGAYPELLVFDPEITKAGQADEVYIETINGKRYVDINDHKTNEKKPQKSAPEKMLQPFQEFYASTHNKYLFQINLYMYMLSLHGFIPRHMAYTHYKNYDLLSANLIVLDNIQQQIKKIF